MTAFVSKQELSQYLVLSGATFRRYRVQGEWIEGIHWIRINKRCVRYNLALIQDWVHNRQNPVAHRRAIEVYQSTLLSHQKASRKNAR